MQCPRRREAGVRAKRIGYWIFTGLLAAELLAGGAWDVARTHYVADVVTRLGYPLYLLTILGVWKLLAVPAVLIPRFGRLKEWAYAGIFFEMTGAVVSHAACGEGSATIAPLVITALAVASWALRPANRRLGDLFAANARGGERI
jgi:hypothetical protein